MKLGFLFVAGSMLFSSQAFADYASHQFHYMEMELSQCKQIATDAAAKSGFFNVQSQDNSYGNGRLYSVVYGTNKEGYSFQYTCDPIKGFAYMIINGPRADVRDKLRDEIGDAIRTAAGKVK